MDNRRKKKESLQATCTRDLLLVSFDRAMAFARNMRQFTVGASLVGGAVSFAGFCIAYRYDLPVGPTDVVLLGVVYGSAFVVWKLVARCCPARRASVASR